MILRLYLGISILSMLLTSCGAPVPVNERSYIPGDSDATIDPSKANIDLRFELSNAMTRVESFELEVSCANVDPMRIQSKRFKLPKSATNCKTELISVGLDGETYTPVSKLTNWKQGITVVLKNAAGKKLYAVLDIALKSHLNELQEVCFTLSHIAISKVLLQDLAITAPEGWKIAQRVQDQGTIILRYQKDDHNFTIYVRKSNGSTIEDTFTDSASIVRNTTKETFNGIEWERVTTSVDFKPQNKTYYVSGFQHEKSGYTYFGFSRSTSQEDAENNTLAFLNQAQFAK